MVWVYCHGIRLALTAATGRPLSDGFAASSPRGRGKALPEGEARAACRRCQCEPVTLAVDHHLRGSPGSLRLNSLNNENVPFVGRGHAPADPVRLRKQSPSSTSPKPSPSGEGGPAKPGRMRGGSVKATTSGKKPTFPPLISQKSKIFASFSPGGSLPNCPVRYIEVNLLLFIGASRFHNYHSPTVVTSRTWLAILAKAAVSRFSWAAVSVLTVMMPPSCFWKSVGTVPLVRMS